MATLEGPQAKFIADATPKSKGDSGESVRCPKAGAEAGPARLGDVADPAARLSSPIRLACLASALDRGALLLDIRRAAPRSRALGDTLLRRRPERVARALRGQPVRHAIGRGARSRRSSRAPAASRNSPSWASSSSDGSSVLAQPSCLRISASCWRRRTAWTRQPCAEARRRSEAAGRGKQGAGSKASAHHQEAPAGGVNQMRCGGSAGLQGRCGQAVTRGSIARQSLRRTLLPQDLAASAPLTHSHQCAVSLLKPRKMRSAFSCSPPSPLAARGGCAIPLSRLQKRQLSEEAGGTPPPNRKAFAHDSERSPEDRAYPGSELPQLDASHVTLQDSALAALSSRSRSDRHVRQCDPT